MDLKTGIIFGVVLVFSAIIHEVAHGYAAYLKGDDTAKLAGRLTLNPLPHIDLLWTIVLPLLFIVSNSKFFLAGAKPVPFNPGNLKNPKYDIPFISFAGPFSNLILALLAVLAIRFVSILPFVATIEIVEFLVIFMQVNIMLAVFNLIPVPPLDGSKLVSLVLPEQIAYSYMTLSPVIGLAAIYVLVKLGVFQSIFYPIVSFFINVLAGL